jgi:hypothetical protein
VEEELVHPKAIHLALAVPAHEYQAVVETWAPSDHHTSAKPISPGLNREPFSPYSKHAKWTQASAIRRPVWRSSRWVERHESIMRKKERRRKDKNLQHATKTLDPRAADKQQQL